MNSNSHQQYLINKQILDMLSTMTDADKKQMCLYLSNKNNNDKVVNMLKNQDVKVNEIYRLSKNDTFGKAVLANVTGDAIWTVAERLIVKLFK